MPKGFGKMLTREYATRLLHKQQQNLPLYGFDVYQFTAKRQLASSIKLIGS